MWWLLDSVMARCRQNIHHTEVSAYRIHLVAFVILGQEVEGHHVAAYRGHLEICSRPSPFVSGREAPLELIHVTGMAC